jgi:pilus assembly protein Flp/PilA
LNDDKYLVNRHREKEWLCGCLVHGEERVAVLQAACLISTREGIMKNLLMRLWKEEEGQDLTEYALLLVLLSLAAVATLNTLAGAIKNVFTNAATNLQGQIT